MRRRNRVSPRLLFCLVSVLLLCGMIAMPELRQPTLYRAEILSRTNRTTPHACAAAGDVRSSTLSSVLEPPAEEEKAPPVEGDILGLMYHDLTENEAATSAWTTMPDKFRADMVALLDAGYEPLSLEDYVAGNIRPGQDYFVVTFDDGYEANLTMALPILTELFVPGTVFVITGSVTVDGHMTWDQLRELASSGVVTVYSHTETHMKANENTLQTFLADERTAWAQIEENLTPAMKAMAYPHGAYTRETMETLAAEGYAVFAVQDVPWWYVKDNEAGVRILLRYNVAYESDILSIAELSRSRAGLPTIAEATAIREEATAAEQAAKEAEARAWIEHAKAQIRAEGERSEKRK